MTCILPEGQPQAAFRLFNIRENMKFSRINETTIGCYLTQEDLAGSGINLDDIMERKEKAMEYLRHVILEAAKAENFRLDGGVTTMQIRAMMDGSLSLTLSCTQPEGTTPAEAGNTDLFRIPGGTAQGTKPQGTQEPLPGPAGGQGNTPKTPGLDEVLAAAQGHAEEKTAGMDRKVAEALNPPRAGKRGLFCYIFRSLADAIECCRKIPDTAKLNSSLWQDRGDGAYYLFLSSAGDEVLFEKTILAMNEFGTFSDAPAETVAYIMEHERCILKENAAAQLVNL